MTPKTLFRYLENLPWTVGAVAAVFVFVVFSVAGTLVARKVLNQKTLKAHHDVAGVVFTNLGVLYAVLLGFIVVNAQSRFDNIRKTVELEAGYLEQMYRDAAVFNENHKIQIQNGIKTYIVSVLEEEWASMRNGEKSQKVDESLNAIWNGFYHITPANLKEDAWYKEAIGKLNQLMQTRLSRILESNSALGAEMWSLLFIGGFTVIMFIYFFGIESLGSHILMTVILAAVTAFFLFLIHSFDTAFSGGVSIKPEAFERILSSFPRDGS